MKIFRWQGVMVFGGFAAVLAVGILLFLDGFIRSTIEEQGSRSAGTEIDLASVSTSLARQSVELAGLAVANPDNPMENAVSIDSIRVDLDGNRGLRRKIIIDDMAMEGIRFNQKRSVAARSFKSNAQEAGGETGAPGGEGATKAGGGKSLLGGLDFQSPADILKNEKLETLEAAETIRKIIADLNQKWQNRIETDLNPKALDDIKTRLAALQGKKSGGGMGNLGDLASLPQEIEKVQKEVQGQIGKIQNYQKELQSDLQEARKLVAELKDLPRKDYERLKNKYSLNMEGGANILGAVLGDEIKARIDTYRKYYEMVRPYLKKKDKGPAGEKPEYERGRGIFVKFPESPPYPGFLIRSGKLSMELMGIPVAGQVRNFSDNQKALGQPAEINFNSGATEMFQGFALDIKMDRTGGTPLDILKTKVQSLNLKQFDAGDAVKIGKGLGDVDGEITLRNEQDLSGEINARFGQMGMTFTHTGGDEISKAIGNALSSVDRFNLKLVLGGTLENYTLDIQSDLNDVLAKAVSGALTAKVADFQNSLKSSIGSATGGAVGDAEGLLVNLNGVGGVFSDRQSSWSNVLGQTKGSSLVPGGGAKSSSKEKSSLPLPGGLKLPF